MAGAQQYKDVEILFVLKAILRGLSFQWIIAMFERRFGRRLTENQVRYIKNKYGRDPRFGTPIANAHNFGFSNSTEWPDNDSVLEIDFSQFERQRPHIPQPNLRVTDFPRMTTPQPAPAPAPATENPDRSPKKTADSPGKAGDTCQATSESQVNLAGQKRAHDDDDVVDEQKDSPNLHIDQYLFPDEPLGTDIFVNGVDSVGYTTPVSSDEGALLCWDRPFNPEAYFFGLELDTLFTTDNWHLQLPHIP